MITVDLGRLSRQLDGSVRDSSGAVLRAFAQDIFDRAEAGADAHTKTGALARSAYLRRTVEGYEIGHDPKIAPHAVFVHWGTRPHKIEPKTKKTLRWAAGGAFHFAKAVNHPGYKGDAWLARATLEATRALPEIVRRTLRT